MEGKLCPILPLRCFLSYGRLLIERFQVLKAVLRPALLISKQLSAAEADTLVYNQRWAIGSFGANWSSTVGLSLSLYSYRPYAELSPSRDSCFS